MKTTIQGGPIETLDPELQAILMKRPDCYETWSFDDCLTRDPPCPFAFKCETAYLQKIEDEKHEN